jgi:hypothetical protein
MNEHLRQRIQRRLEALPDDRGYQILDYIEFLETRYAERAAPAANPFTKFTDAVEDRLRAGRVSATAIAETVGLMNRAASVLNGAMQATKTMANELASVPEAMRQAAASGTANAPTSGAAAAPRAPATPTPEASSPAHETKQPGSGEEKL